MEICYSLTEVTAVNRSHGTKGTKNMLKLGPLKKIFIFGLENVGLDTVANP